MALAPHESDPERFKPFAYLTAPNAALYRRRYDLFRAFYERTKDLMAALDL